MKSQDIIPGNFYRIDGSTALALGVERIRRNYSAKERIAVKARKGWMADDDCRYYEPSQVHPLSDNPDRFDAQIAQFRAEEALRDQRSIANARVDTLDDEQFNAELDVLYLERAQANETLAMARADLARLDEQIRPFNRRIRNRQEAEIRARREVRRQGSP